MGKGFTANSLTTANIGLVPSLFYGGGNSEATTKVPKVYINYIFFPDREAYQETV
jgi:hypothetical protein